MQTLKQPSQTEIFKMLSSKTRLKIIKLLMTSKCDICVKDIAKEIGMTHSATSHQLSILEDKKVVECCRNGQTMCYKIADSDIANKIKSIMMSI